MGQRGPAPAPVALKVLKGETRPSQLKGSPSAQEPPPKPTDMAPAASKVWDRVLKATEASSHIGQAHADTFRRYCEVVATLDEMRPPGSKEWRELVNVQRQLARELCLTPATGGHLATTKPAASKLDRFISRAG